MCVCTLALTVSGNGILDTVANYNAKCKFDPCRDNRDMNNIGTIDSRNFSKRYTEAVLCAKRFDSWIDSTFTGCSNEYSLFMINTLWISIEHSVMGKVSVFCSLNNYNKPLVLLV